MSSTLTNFPLPQIDQRLRVVLYSHDLASSWAHVPRIHRLLPQQWADDCVARAPRSIAKGFYRSNLCVFWV